LLPGDLAFKHDNGAVFKVDEQTAAAPETVERLKGRAISPSGPMWGPGMTRAEGAPGEREAAALAAAGVTEAHFEAWKKHTGRTIPGERRPLRVPVVDPEVEGGVDEHGAYVRCAFELPRGAFATTVLREVIKPGEGESMDASGEHDSD
jgi:tRNA pseudouridine13 synthase